MAAAFVNLEVPPVYAMLFYLGLFVAGLMFLVSEHHNTSLIYKLIFMNKAVIMTSFYMVIFCDDSGLILWLAT